MRMTPKEELIQAIERLPDDLVGVLLELLKVLQRQRSPEAARSVPREPEMATVEEAPSRLHRKQGVLVIETGHLHGFDINAFINEVREERFQNQIEQADT